MTGKAVMKVPLSMLEELLGFRGKEVAIVAMAPPHPADIQKQMVTFLLESEAFPPTHPAMALPEVYGVYTMRANGPQFLGFDVVGEPEELPEEFHGPNADGEYIPKIPVSKLGRPGHTREVTYLDLNGNMSIQPPPKFETDDDGQSPSMES